MAKPKLLIVEDDEGLCSQYRWAFPACEVMLTHARPAAIALAKKESPPVAIMDLGLPPDPDGVSEGFATLEEMQRLIRDAGFTPARRRQDYSVIAEELAA